MTRYRTPEAYNMSGITLLPAASRARTPTIEHDNEHERPLQDTTMAAEYGVLTNICGFTSSSSTRLLLHTQRVYPTLLSILLGAKHAIGCVYCSQATSWPNS
jgi:hypothetical protein